MSENESWLSKFLKDIPSAKVEIDPYYTEHQDVIREEIDQLLAFRIPDEKFKLVLEAWSFRNALIARCDQYDFAVLRKKIDQFIVQIEEFLSIQRYIVNAVNFLAPITSQRQIENVISVDYTQLGTLKLVREELFRRRGSKGDENFWTKRAYFEIFFIGELLGLKPPTQNYKNNDLISFATILTEHTRATRDNISDHYQDYEKVKRKIPLIITLIKEGNKASSDHERWYFFLEKFQTYIYPYISVPS